MDYEIRYSQRKSVGIEVTKEAKVLVRAPYGTSVKQIQYFVEAHADWIIKHRQKVLQQIQAVQTREPIDVLEIEQLAQQAAKVIPERAAYFAGVMGVTYGRITIRNQKTRWGSCSSKGNLNFNCLLMLVPAEVLDYVVVHELCHRKEMNHSPRFWREVEKVLPRYREQERWLKEHGSTIIRSVDRSGSA